MRYPGEMLHAGIIMLLLFYVSAVAHTYQSSGVLIWPQLKEKLQITFVLWDIRLSLNLWSTHMAQIRLICVFLFGLSLSGINQWSIHEFSRVTAGTICMDAGWPVYLQAKQSCRCVILISNQPPPVHWVKIKAQKAFCVRFSLSSGECIWGLYNAQSVL